MQIVGLGHYSRVGKDTLAHALIACLHEREPKLRVKKLPLAWKLKKITYDLYAWAGMREPEFYDTPEGEKYRDIVLPVLGMTPVDVWVKFGTDAVRENVYQDTWLDYVFESDHGCDVLIVPDVRFPNEHAKAREKNAKLVKVVRPGYGPRKTKADRALLGCVDWDIVAGSSGEIHELQLWASRLACEITGGREVWQTIDEKANALKVEVIEPCEYDPVTPYAGGCPITTPPSVRADVYQVPRMAEKIEVAVIGGNHADAGEIAQKIKAELRRSPNGPPGQGSRATVGGFLGPREGYGD